MDCGGCLLCGEPAHVPDDVDDVDASAGVCPVCGADGGAVGRIAGGNLATHEEPAMLLVTPMIVDADVRGMVKLLRWQPHPAMTGRSLKAAEPRSDEILSGHMREAWADAAARQARHVETTRYPEPGINGLP